MCETFEWRVRQRATGWLALSKTSASEQRVKDFSPQLVFCESSKKRERAESGGLQSVTRFLRVEQEPGCGVLLKKKTGFLWILMTITIITTK